MASGRGRFILADGDMYEGNWVNGQRAGQGTQEYADGRIFSGTWADDEPVFGTMQLVGKDPRPVRVEDENFVWAD